MIGYVNGASAIEKALDNKMINSSLAMVMSHLKPLKLWDLFRSLIFVEYDVAKPTCIADSCLAGIFIRFPGQHMHMVLGAYTRRAGLGAFKKRCNLTYCTISVQRFTRYLNVMSAGTRPSSSEAGFFPQALRSSQGWTLLVPFCRQPWTL